MCSQESIQRAKSKITEKLSLAQPLLQFSKITFHVQLRECFLSSVQNLHLQTLVSSKKNTQDAVEIWYMLLERSGAKNIPECNRRTQHIECNILISLSFYIQVHFLSEFPLPLASFRNSAMFPLLLNSAQATVSLSTAQNSIRKHHQNANVACPNWTTQLCKTALPS